MKEKTKNKMKVLTIAFLIVSALVLTGCPDPGDSEGGNWSGTKLTGATFYETYGNAVAVDASGNVLKAGTIESEMANVPNVLLDGQYIMGTETMYVKKYGSNGSAKWTRTLGTYTGSAKGNGVAVDADGNVYVVGSTMTQSIGGDGYIEYGLDGQRCLDDSIPADGVYTMFLTKYSASGVKQWTRLQAAGDNNLSNAYGLGVTTDSLGNVYVCGSAQGDVQTPNGVTEPTLAGDEDLFVSKFDSDGILQFTTMAGIAGTGSVTKATSIALSEDELYIFITGSTTGNLWGTTNGQSMIVGYLYNDASSSFDGIQLDAAAASSFEGTSIRTAYDADELIQNVFAVGSTTGGYDLDLTLESGTYTDANTQTCAYAGFFIKLTFNSAVLGSEIFDMADGTANPDLFESAAATNDLQFTGIIPSTDNNTAYVCGFANFSLDGANPGATLNGRYDSILLQYPADTATQAMLGSVGDYTYGNAIGINSSNQVFVVGETHASVLDGSAANGAIDSFVTKYSLSSEGQVVHY